MKTPDFLTTSVKNALDEDKLLEAMTEQVEDFIDYDELAEWVLDQLRDSIQEVAHEAAIDKILPF